MPPVVVQKTRALAAIGAALAFVCTELCGSPVLAAELTVHPMRRTAVIATVNTLEGALIQAYQNNPQLNAQRASVRATDETVPQALSGYRPRISLSASAGEAFIDSTSRSTSSTGVVSYPRS